MIFICILKKEKDWQRNIQEVEMTEDKEISNKKDTMKSCQQSYKSEHPTVYSAVSPMDDG